MLLMPRSAEAGSNRLTDTPHAFGNQHRREVEGLLDAVAGEELEFLCAPKLTPRKPDPRPRFQVSRFFHRWTALDQGRRSGEVERDLSRRSGDHAFVRDFAGQDSDVATLLNHVQRTVANAELRGDFELVCKKLLSRRVTMDCPKSTVANRRKWPLSIV